MAKRNPKRMKILDPSRNQGSSFGSRRRSARLNTPPTLVDSENGLLEKRKSVFKNPEPGPVAMFKSKQMIVLYDDDGMDENLDAEVDKLCKVIMDYIFPAAWPPINDDNKLYTIQKSPPDAQVNLMPIKKYHVVDGGDTVAKSDIAQIKRVKPIFPTIWSTIERDLNFPMIEVDLEIQIKKIRMDANLVDKYTQENASKLINIIQTNDVEVDKVGYVKIGDLCVHVFNGVLSGGTPELKEGERPKKSIHVGEDDPGGTEPQSSKSVPKN